MNSIDTRAGRSALATQVKRDTGLVFNPNIPVELMTHPTLIIGSYPEDPQSPGRPAFHTIQAGLIVLSDVWSKHHEENKIKPLSRKLPDEFDDAFKQAAIILNENDKGDFSFSGENLAQVKGHFKRNGAIWGAIAKPPENGLSPNLRTGLIRLVYALNVNIAVLAMETGMKDGSLVPVKMNLKRIDKPQYSVSRLLYRGDKLKEEVRRINYAIGLYASAVIAAYLPEDQRGGLRAKDPMDWQKEAIDILHDQNEKRGISVKGGFFLPR